MESDLPFPTHFHRYVSETFRTENILQPEYHRFFRVVPASRFLSLFSSDRKHMLRSDGTWIKPPPNYPPIFNGVSNLESFLDMTTPKNEYGEIFSLMELVRRFYKPRQLS
ncbi:Protein N-terminal glutamine amidohydrolase [Orchesella cincta]|uniref:Protein N-terminal glutamine amidohydrolase n=1 Tax=Orchesella cincta TaxID=48709 RepID=A0A1D2N809_ORCCI|nr:Protein N-terminal glutamine amidohydrolase [Orchesella cincta]